ncbi:hypothetical protein Nepgr_015346 [Nepenthes gracilis]|uniref:Uncharacterized protein n=1 Tax=Nepenthes gracilis TaxID=150966 RepID=A0AAD3SKY3_NEPGR|nr:hypothetical protein Nepgr_015346 [Nepenthes gracilis]
MNVHNDKFRRAYRLSSACVRFQIPQYSSQIRYKFACFKLYRELRRWKLSFYTAEKQKFFTFVSQNPLLF